jgi:predicted permease
MRTLRAWWSRARGFIAPGRGERDFADELQSHLDLHIDDNLRAGMTPDEARRRALIKLGSIASVSEAQRERRGLPWLESIVQDVRYALRGIRRQPGFAAACIATLALGIGANSAIFSVVNGVLFAPLPYDDPDRLVSLWIRNPTLHREGNPLSAPDVAELRRMLTSMDVEALQANIIPISVMVGDEAVPAQGVLMTAGMFRMLGRAPMLGRWLEDTDVPGTIVISHAFWQRRLGGDPGVIGRSISDGRRPLTVVGVMPPEFLFPYPSMLRAAVTFSSSSEVDFWSGLSETVAADRAFRDRNTRLIGVVARLKDGVSLDAARADAEVAWRQLAQAYPDSNGGWEAQVLPLHEQAVGDVRQQLLLLLGSVGMVLVVACVNVTNLLLARGMARQRELALRAALGAGRRRLLQQVLVESLTFSIVGAAAGILFAKWATPLLVSSAPAGTPRLSEITVSWTVVTFTAVVAILCGLVAGVLPGVGAARTNVRQTLDEGTRGSSAGRHQLRGALVAAQLALAVVLSVGAVLLARSFVAVVNTDPGFRSDRLLTLQVNVPGSYTAAVEKHLAFYRSLLTRLEAVPGVVSVGGTTRLPLGGTNSSTQIAVEGRVPPEGQWPDVDFRRAVHRYFETMEIPLRRGRMFTDADRDGAPPVAVINESLARKFFGNEDPIGRQIRLGPSSPLRTATIVGIVGDLRHQRLDTAPNPEVYLNYLQAPPYAPLMVIRTVADPAELAPSIRHALRDVDASIRPLNVKTMSELRSASVAPRIFLMALIAAFGVLALVLAGVGVYGVLSLAVAERTREIGIRLALGASPRELVALVMTHALIVTGAGALAGVAVAIVLSPLVAAQLYGVTATDPATITAVVIALVAIASIAAAIPAARVLRIDPVATLRCD